MKKSKARRKALFPHASRPVFRHAKWYFPVVNENALYAEKDWTIVGKTMVVRYAKLDFNRHQHGFEKGVAPLFQKCKETGIDTVLLDMEETAHIESLTLGTIIKFKKEINRIGVPNIRILHPAPQLEEAFVMQNLDKIFGKPLHSLDEALRELAPKNSGQA